MAGGAGVRRRRVPGGRPIAVQVKFTADEYAAVVLRAAAAQLSVPSYLALTALRPEGAGAADARSALTGLDGVRRVLAGVASNLNQLTAKLHSTGEVDVALPAVLDAVAGLTARVESAAEEVAAGVGGGRR